MYYRSCIYLGDPPQNPLSEFGLGRDPDLPQKRVSHFPEQRFHQVEPGAVLWGMNIMEAVGPSRQIGTSLTRDMSRVVIHNDPDLHIRRIMSIQVLEQRHEFSAPMPFLDSRHHVPVVQIQRRQD